MSNQNPEKCNWLSAFPVFWQELLQLCSCTDLLNVFAKGIDSIHESGQGTTATLSGVCIPLSCFCAKFAWSVTGLFHPRPLGCMLHKEPSLLSSEASLPLERLLEAGSGSSRLSRLDLLQEASHICLRRNPFPRRARNFSRQNIAVVSTRCTSPNVVP